MIAYLFPALLTMGILLCAGLTVKYIADDEFGWIRITLLILGIVLTVGGLITTVMTFSGRNSTSLPTVYTINTVTVTKTIEGTSYKVAYKTSGGEPAYLDCSMKNLDCPSIEPGDQVAVVVHRGNLGQMSEESEVIEVKHRS